VGERRGRPHPLQRTLSQFAGCRGISSCRALTRRRTSSSSMGQSINNPSLFLIARLWRGEDCGKMFIIHLDCA